MRNTQTLFWGTALIVIGLAGLAVTWFLAWNGSLPAGNGAFTSDGQRIYYTGLDADGRPIPRSLGGFGMMGDRGMMGVASCVDCHGEDGRGGGVTMRFGAVQIPDIRYSALTSSHSEDGTTAPGWTDAEIARAIREGIEPDGERLESPMPRWDMTDDEVEDVIAYLKELDSR